MQFVNDDEGQASFCAGPKSGARAGAGVPPSAVKARTFIVVGRARVYHNKSERLSARIPRVATLPAVRRRVSIVRTVTR